MILSGGAAASAVQAQSATPESLANTVNVDCGAGESLRDAIAEHGGGYTYQVRGTCNEHVTVDRDGITIDGGREAVIDAGNAENVPVVHVDGARNVTLRGVTLQNGHWGALIEELSTVLMEDVVTRANVTHGVEVIFSHVVVNNLHSQENGRVGLIVDRNSELRLTDSTLESNGISGLVIFSSAIGRLEGTNLVRGNGAQGVTLGQGGKIFTIAAELIIEDNGSQGLSLLQGAEGQFLGGTLTVRGNEGDGIALDLASTLVLGIAEFGVPGDVTIEENGGHGMSVRGHSQVVVDATMPADIRSNAGSGVYADAGHVTISGSVIEANDGVELELDFGATATFADTNVDEIACGEGVLVRGSIVCGS
jgi:hypothetical protein